ncbi:MAG TPA: SDR family oxidoreductase [Stellaceae bacterium]|nr:SDR family oxidoreductase [Stellaceae bacterium]
MIRAESALVVGASRGLGLGLAAELQRRGWNVVATAREETGMRRLGALAAEPGGSLPGALIVECVDINDDAAVTALRRRLDERIFDLVFVSAGIAPAHGHDAVLAGRDEIALLFQTNAVSPIRLARRFLDRVRDGSGVVALMSSGLGSVADNTHGYSELYSASKAALNSLTRSLAAKLGGRRITVLAMAPGWVRTDLGGPAAPLSVEESARGLLDVIAARRGTLRHGFVDYRGRELAW